jgi:hypothetical protein
MTAFGVRGIDRLAVGGALSIDDTAAARARRVRRIADYTVGAVFWLALIAVGWAALVVA